MATTTYVRQRGETITIALTDTGATSPAAPLVTAYARAMANERVVDPAATPIRLLPQYRAADANYGVGWTISLDAGACAALSALRYGLDVKITDGQGAAIITELAVLKIVEPASALPTIAPATITYPDPTGITAPFSGIRTIAWIPDAPASTPNPAAIVGPPGPAGSGTGGGGLGTPVTFTVTTGGPQAFAFTGTRAIVFLNGLLQPPTSISIAGGNLTLSALAGAANGDVIVAYSF
jgi:hypothetical protein